MMCRRSLVLSCGDLLQTQTTVSIQTVSHHKDRSNTQFCYILWVGQVVPSWPSFCEYSLLLERIETSFHVVDLALLLLRLFSSLGVTRQRFLNWSSIYVSFRKCALHLQIKLLTNLIYSFVYIRVDYGNAIYCLLA